MYVPVYVNAVTDASIVATKAAVIPTAVACFAPFFLWQRVKTARPVMSAVPHIANAMRLVFKGV